MESASGVGPVPAPVPAHGVESALGVAPVPASASPPASPSAASGPTPEERLRAARRKAERLIGVRERSVAELGLRLAQAGFEEALVAQVVGEAQAAGLVDDGRFARLYIEGKKRSGWGRSRIEQGLERFGIEPGCHEGCPAASFSDDDELERARACLERFRSRAKDPQAARYRHLLSKGFSPQIARRAVL
ncbi:MAG: recombination regulator RecX [Coriobacteriales bacterium]|jgi:regulatory protein|nr:recombination regulator RecX [Coriobacteriales bacterium]